MNLNKLVLIVVTVFFTACNSNDDLLEKLNNNTELIIKYNEFKSQGVEKEIDFKKNIIENVIDTAFSFIGSPNVYGGIDKAGIDASALVYVSISKNSKIQFPRIAQDMARYGKQITDPDKLKGET